MEQLTVVHIFPATAPGQPPKRHELKVWPEHFVAIYNGQKTHEVRLNDREFAVGDTLYLREHSVAMQQREARINGAVATVSYNVGEYSGRSCFKKITHILYGGQYGIVSGYVVLSLGVINS